MKLCDKDTITIIQNYMNINPYPTIVLAPSKCNVKLQHDNVNIRH